MTGTSFSPRKRPRQLRAQDTRERLLRAAARVFAEYGYAHGTTNRIAAEAGHSIGSLYQYFPNKDAMLVELATAHANEGIAAVEALLATPELAGSLPETIGLFVRVTMDAHDDDPALHRIMLEQAPRSPELMRLLYDAEERIITAVAGLLSAHPEVRVADTGLAARLVVGGIESLVHRFVATGPVDRRAEFAEELTTMLTRYLTGDQPPNSGRVDSTALTMP